MKKDDGNKYQGQMVLEAEVLAGLKYCWHINKMFPRVQQTIRLDWADDNAKKEIIKFIEQGKIFI